MTPQEKCKELIDKFYQSQIEVLNKIGLTEFEKIEHQIAIKSSLIAVEEMLNNELLTDLLQLPDEYPQKYKAIYQKMWLTDVKNELLKQQNNG